MKSTDVFPSNALRAADLGTASPVVTIENVTLETFDDGQKPAVHFKGKDKPLILNKTNWNTIVEITGEEDSDNWTGKKIRLYVTKVEYQGKRVPAIRVDAVDAPKPVQAPSEDEVPF